MIAKKSGFHIYTSLRDLDVGTCFEFEDFKEGDFKKTSNTTYRNIDSGRVRQITKTARNAAVDERTCPLLAGLGRRARSR